MKYNTWQVFERNEVWGLIIEEAEENGCWSAFKFQMPYNYLLRYHLSLYRQLDAIGLFELNLFQVNA